MALIEQSLLETVDLRKTYTISKHVEIAALRDINLKIYPGELVAIMGPSGCGKSTLMHILGGMSRATSGRVLIDGYNLAVMTDGQRSEVRRKRIGFVFQKFNLLPTLTARANIDVARALYGDTTPDRREHLAEVLDLLKIKEKLNRKPAELSGGEQQRVAIARAVVNRPAIVLADEPTGSLDSMNSEIVLNIFKQLNRKFRQTIVLVTHNPEVVAHTDRLIEMRDGLIIADRVQREFANLTGTENH